MVEKATINDLSHIDNLAIKVINHMQENNIPQWTLDYPRLKDFSVDVINEALLCIKSEDHVLAVCAIYEENDPPYKTISSWKKDHSIVIHRVLVDPTAQRKGLAQQLLDYIIEYANRHHYESIKIDTHLENYKMRGFLTKNGFVEGDYIDMIDRIAYEKVLEE